MPLLFLYTHTLLHLKHSSLTKMVLGLLIPGDAEWEESGNRMGVCLASKLQRILLSFWLPRTFLCLENLPALSSHLLQQKPDATFPVSLAARVKTCDTGSTNQMACYRHCLESWFAHNGHRFLPASRGSRGQWLSGASQGLALQGPWSPPWGWWCLCCTSSAVWVSGLS